MYKRQLLWYAHSTASSVAKHYSPASTLASSNIRFFFPLNTPNHNLLILQPLHLSVYCILLLSFSIQDSRWSTVSSTCPKQSIFLDLKNLSIMFIFYCKKPQSVSHLPFLSFFYTRIHLIFWSKTFKANVSAALRIHSSFIIRVL